MDTYYVVVKYKLNRISIGTPLRGMEVSEIRKLACAKLEENASRHYLVSNGQRLREKDVIKPFSTLDLICYDDTGDHESSPNLCCLLYETTLSEYTKQRDELFQMAAQDVFNQMQIYFMTMARYRQWRVVIDFNKCHLSTWNDVVTRVLKEESEQDMALAHLETFCIREGLFPKINNRIWLFEWKKPQQELTMPRITTRDLISMGYDPAQGDLFKRILNRLRRAIEVNEVSGESELAQRQWIRKHFYQ